MATRRQFLAGTGDAPCRFSPASQPRGKKDATGAGSRPVRDGTRGPQEDRQRLRIPLIVTTAMLRRVCEQACGETVRKALEAPLA